MARDTGTRVPRHGVAVLSGCRLPGTLSCGVSGPLVLDGGVGVRVVHAAGDGEQLLDALPFREFGQVAHVLGQVLMVAVELLQARSVESGDCFAVGHAESASADRGAAGSDPVGQVVRKDRRSGPGSIGMLVG